MWMAKFNQCSKRQPFYTEFMSGPSGGQTNIYKEILLKVIGRSQHTVGSILAGLMTSLVPKMYSMEMEKADLKALDDLRKELLGLMGPNGVLLYPSFPKLTQYHNRALLDLQNAAYVALFNALGFPVTQCALGLSKAGLPMGIQVASGPGNDRLTIAVACTLEKEFGGWVSPGM